MRPFSHFQPILQLDLRWPLTLVYDLWLHEHKGSHIISINQVWFKSDFNFSNEAIFTFSAYLTTWPQMTFDLDITFDSINKWGFPSCIYDPTLVEIHQRMWKIEPNVNPFHNRQRQRQATTNDRQQGTKWSLCVRPGKNWDHGFTAWFTGFRWSHGFLKVCSDFTVLRFFPPHINTKIGNL